MLNALLLALLVVFTPPEDSRVADIEVGTCPSGNKAAVVTLDMKDGTSARVFLNRKREAVVTITYDSKGDATTITFHFQGGEPLPFAEGLKKFGNNPCTEIDFSLSQKGA
jgi:hypothetical protein